MNANGKIMEFSLFKQNCFKVSHPIALIESYCFQSDFFSKYDLLLDRMDVPSRSYCQVCHLDLLNVRTVEDAAKIGAFIFKSLIPDIEKVTKSKENHNLEIFSYCIDCFLKLSDNKRNRLLREFNEEAILKLIEKKYIKLSKATKVYHTLYPQIIPMIDKLLQEKYKKEINPQWSEEQPYQIFVDFYDNLKENNNLHNISQLQDELSDIGITCLTKVRIFDILWWSFLKAENKAKKINKKLKENEKINWSTIGRVYPL